jgi:hypothetical protein
MSIPAWQHYLEEVEFKLAKTPDLIIDWLLNSPVAKEIPENILKARLAKYGYKEPEPVIKPLTTKERQASKTRAKRNRKDAE